MSQYELLSEGDRVRKRWGQIELMWEARTEQSPSVSFSHSFQSCLTVWSTKSIHCHLFFFAPNLEQQIDAHIAMFIQQKYAVFMLGWLLGRRRNALFVLPFWFASLSDLSADLFSGSCVRNTLSRKLSVRPVTPCCFLCTVIKYSYGH